jgi:apolipoprotein N-acyltransferase
VTNSSTDAGAPTDSISAAEPDRRAHSGGQPGGGDAVGTNPVRDEAAEDDAASGDEPAGKQPARRTAGRPPGVPALPAAGLAVAGGLALLGSFPSLNLWWLAPIGVALITVAIHRRTFWGGFRLAGLAGLVFFVPLLHWTHIVGGAAPWVLLAIAEAAYLALTGAAAAYASPLFDTHRWTWPLATAALWVGQEAVRDRVPFGGFPWGRLAFSQADSPALRFAAVGGAPLVTFVIALAGGLLALAAWRSVERLRAPLVSNGARRPRAAVAAIAAIVIGAIALLPLGLAVPLHAPAGRAVQVAIVQGNVPRLGLEFNAQRRAVLDNHVRATLALAAEVAAGKRPRPDIVIWPENSSDIDPLVADVPGNADAANEITEAADVIGAPILVGAVLEGPGNYDRNAAIVWQPGSNGGPQSGPNGTYVKLHPVPFAEYMPIRSIARLVSSRADLVVHDFLAGTTRGVLNMGGVTVGDAICFEVAYDNIVRDTVTGGAQLLTVQTNNADFDAAEASQQLAMVRLRAVEHGRDALMVSTVGISAFVDSSGGVHNATKFNIAATELRQLRLSDQRTLATRLGPIPEFVASGLAVGFLIAAVWVRRRNGSGDRRAVATKTEHKVTAA